MALIPTPPAEQARIPVSKIGKDGSMDKQTALDIVRKDNREAESYMSQRMWILRWREIDNLYQSPRPISTWEGTQTAESNVTSFMVAKHTNALVPAVMTSIFYQDPFFKLRPSPSMSEEIVRLKESIFTALFREMEFEDQMWDMWFYTVLFGTAIAKWGVCETTKQKTTYKRKGRRAKLLNHFGSITLDTKDSKEIEATDEEEDFWYPEINHIPNEQVLVDPSLNKPDIRKAKYVIHIMPMNGYDLLAYADNHRGEEGYDIPDDATIRSYFDTPVEPTQAEGVPEAQMGNSTTVTHAEGRFDTVSGDPLMKPLKAWEHWTKKHVTLVINEKEVWRNAPNPFGKIPFYSSHWWRIPNAFWSLGVGHLAGQDQRVDQGSRNAALNILSMSVNPVVLRTRGNDQPGQNIRLRRGSILTVDGDDIRKAMGFMQMPQVPPELWQVLAAANANAESSTGADQTLAQGNTAGGRTSMLRTAGGAAIADSAQATRLQGPVSRFVKTVLEPWIYQMDELINEEMPEKQMIAILGQDHAEDYIKENFDIEDYLNSRCKFEILAIQHLAAKKGMAQMLPLIAQIFEGQMLQQLHQIGWTIDPLELVMMFMEVSEFTNRFNLVRKLDDNEKQMLAQAQQGQASAKAGIQKDIDNNKARNQAELNAEKADDRAVELALRKATEAAITPELLTGAAGGQYASEEGA